MRRMNRRQPLGGAVQVQLDHLGRAGADKEQLADVGAAGQQAGHFAVKLGIGIGKAGQILFLKDRGAESGFGKDHHAGRGLQQVRTGAAAHDQEEGVLHLAVQPDDAGQAAEHLALAAFLQNGVALQPAVGRSRLMPLPLRPCGSLRRGHPRPRHPAGPCAASTGTARVDDVGGIGGQRDGHLGRGRQRTEKSPYRYQVCSAMTAKLNTSSQKKAGAKRYWPKTTFSQIAPVTMMV